MPLTAKERSAIARNAGLASAAKRDKEAGLALSRKASAARWAGHTKKERPFLPSASDLSEHDIPANAFAADDSDSEWEVFDDEE